jgi:hypothetical protein
MSDAPQQLDGKPHEMTDVQLFLSSAKHSGTEHLRAAAETVEELFAPLPILDWVTDPRAYLAKVIEIFGDYPASVWLDAKDKIQRNNARPPTDFITKVLDEVYGPIRRAHERERIERLRANEPEAERRRHEESIRRADERRAAQKAELAALKPAYRVRSQPGLPMHFIPVE